MQEKWAWDKSTFLSFARHYQTGEQLSEAVYDNMMQMRRFGQGALLCCVVVMFYCYFHTALTGQDASTPACTSAGQRISGMLGVQ
jgi:Zn-dependent oligopeptidase